MAGLWPNPAWPGTSPILSPAREDAEGSLHPFDPGLRLTYNTLVSHAAILQFLRFLCGGVCHQLPERSLQIAGVPLPLCARCTGTYLGVAVGLLAVVAGGRLRAGRLPRWPALVALGVCFLLWAIDGVNSYLALFPGLPHLYEPRNTLRLLTGAFEGLALFLVAWPVAAATLLPHPRDERVISLRGLALTLASAAAVVLVVSRQWPVALYATAVLSVLSLFGMFTLLNALVLAVIFHSEVALPARGQAMRFLGFALALAGLELILLSLLRRLLLGF